MSITTTKRNKPLSDLELQGLLQSQIQRAVNYMTDTFTRARIEANKYYEGDPSIWPYPAGRSSVVSRELAEAVDQLMPNLMRVFTSIETPCRFVPTKPGDSAYADQATDYINHIWNVQNDGFVNFHHWFKSALLHRIGVVSIDWVEEESVKQESYENLDEIEYQMLVGDPDVDIHEIAKKPDPTALYLAENQVKAQLAAALMAGQQPPPQPNIDDDKLPQVYDVKLYRRTKAGKVQITPVPSEELLFTEYKVSVDDRQMIGHRRRMSASELREQGFSEKLIDKIPFGDNSADIYLQERYQRHRAETSWPVEEGVLNDPSSLKTWVTTLFMYLDYDGTGIAQFRKIVVAGETELIVLENEVVDEHPFCVVTPVLSCFKMVGQSIHDQIKDLQLVKTVIWRQALDAFNLTHHPRYAISKNVTLDDVLNPRPGAPIRVDGNPSAEIVPLGITPIADVALSMIQYVDQVRQRRLGITDFNSGLNPDELQPQTAAFVQAMQQAGNQRMELIARTYAETGVKRAFRRILDLVTKHERKEQVVQLRGKWVPMRPMDWRNDYAVQPMVGLGTGNRDQELQHMMSLFPVYSQVIQMQGGVHGPFVQPTNLYAALAKLVETAGIKNPELFFTDPSQQPQQQPQQPPQPPVDQAAMMQAQNQRAALAEQQREFDQKHAFELTKLATEVDLKHKQLDQQYAARAAQVQVNAAKLHATSADAGADRAMDTLKMGHESLEAGADRTHEAMQALRQRQHEHVQGQMDRLMQQRQREQQQQPTLPPQQ